MSAARLGLARRAATVGEKPVAYGVALLLLALPALTLVSPDQGGLAMSSQQGYDFAAYYRAGRAVLDGASPYLPETLAGPFSLILQFGYFYPPPFAAAMAPLALLPPIAADAVWTALLAAGLLLAGALIAGAGDPRRAETPTAIVVALALGFSTPGFSGIAAGNVSVLLGVLILAPLLATSSDGVAGWATAVAALAKIEPGLWGAYLLGAGRFHAVLVAAGTGLAIMAATYLLPGVRAGWADYPRVLVNAAASPRAVDANLGGNLSVTGLLGLAPEVAHSVELCFLAVALMLMLLAGRFGARFAPLAAAVAMFSTPSMWLHSTMMVAPAALAVIAMGPGLDRRGFVRLSGVRMAEALAVAFLCASYVCLIFRADRAAPFVLALPLVLAAALLGPGPKARSNAKAASVLSGTER